ncbi:uncharacterized protein PGRI_084600 [Penicillium griseofulvum]|uniref:Uncharacterized protein n=1 Tax=Penicillium patulum TaxID=5078 RepID=A0A135LTB8_PENPA|nr:uncharacterized protein PGRI_084600 [Penicillium griseofulvum]KXG52176.1 hypothetical protein PGRI_084600 [Penicillium griseofulvum]
MRTTVENVNIILPVANPGMAVSSTSINAAILSQLEVALEGFHKKAGRPVDSQIIMNNVNITTNILAGPPPPIAPDAPLLGRVMQPDTPLLDRVQRIPTEPRPIIPGYGPTPVKTEFDEPTFIRSAFSQPARQPEFARPVFPPPIPGQPVFGQTPFPQPTFVQNNSVGITPPWPRHGRL